jgi:Na+:H+ antiporter, NhaA family
MKRLIKKAINPIRLFLNDSRSVGVILIACTLISLFLANSMVGGGYLNIWHAASETMTHLRVPDSFLHWINDFAMAFFFLLAGMEIKRELTVGELSSLKNALLPFGAAFGGMLVPAIIYTIFNGAGPYAHGWGIPTATDIAFSLGVASLLGKRVPVGLKILLMALAIIDDLGAIIVIALFYGNQVNWLFLGTGALLYGGLIACNYFKVKFGPLQIVLALSLWFCIFNAGIEASITGVLVAFALPSDVLPFIEKNIHGVVNFFILPLFALANTAILIPGDIINSLSTNVSMGIMMGLVVGKPVGIFLISRLMVALKIARLPNHIRWSQIFGMGTLAGIGFTMSIFTTTLAFSSPAIKDIAKISILLSVVLSLVLSFVYFYLHDLVKKKEPASAPLAPKPEYNFN